ncbi:MAG: glycosyltransferase family 2 protein [Bacteroidetes bacterium]|nr:glycosyltransferase family 2 protein [Bacteroidota bacterium]
MIEVVQQIAAGLFVLAVILIWFMIGWQLLLTLAGYFHESASQRELRTVDAMEFDYPPVSILIPAHNEEIVIGRTLEAMCALDYPADRLEIIVINDGSSDRTGDIVREFAARDARVICYDVPEGQGGKGKSRALNLGLTQASHQYIAIYDADNTPEPRALRHLAAQLLLHPELGAVLGKFRTVNKTRTLLTRFINIETLSFQSILQAGRWKLLHIATLPGTNFLMRREVIEEMNGWDEGAITEDSELSVRMYIAGWKIKFIPYAVTWEQEPETWGVWLKQRTRWVRGNNYVSKKFLKERKSIPSFRLRFELLYSIALYYVFFVAILISDIIFLLSVSGVIAIPLPGPYTLVWVMAVVLFFAEIMLALSYDREDTPLAFLLIGVMYLTYCQLWLVVVGLAFYKDVIRKESMSWAKTRRFKIEEQQP